MKIFKIILTDAILLLSSTLAFGQTKPEKFEGSLTFVNNIPLPLGRYVQLAETTVPFTIDKYYASPDRDLIFESTYNFKIVRHIPNLQYMSFHAESLEPITRYIKIKFKHDQNAVESLSNAIANTNINTERINWIDTDSEKHSGSAGNLAKKINGAKMKFTDSSVYVRIPQSNIVFKGYNAASINATEPASVNISSKDGVSSLYFAIYVHFFSSEKDHASTIKPSHVTIHTSDRSFEAILKAANMQGVVMYCFEKYKISAQTEFPVHEIKEKC